MKLAFLATDVRQHLRDYGNQRPSFGTAPAALLNGFANLKNLEVHIVSCAQEPLRSPEKLADNIWFYSLHVPKSGWMRTLYQGCIRAIRKQLRAIQPDIVHGQGTERECAISAALSGFPNVVTIHGNMSAMAEFYRAPIGSFHWLAGKLETFALKRTLGVFCNSAYTEMLVAPHARKIWRVPNALQLPFFQPLPERGQNEYAILLNVGVTAPYKRQADILSMAKRLWERGFRFEIHFAGAVQPGQPYDRAFLAALAEAEKAGYARHLGSLPADQLVAAMDAADAMVHFPTEESFGLVVAEALARNLKLFAGSVGGVVDIASGVDGVELFPMNDFTTLENSIARWIEAGHPRSGRAHETIRERYHPDVIARRHMEIYQEVLKTRS